jgi:hypothetical protein
MNQTEKYMYEPIDLCACYEPMEEPPAWQLAQWRRMWERQNPFSGTVKRKIGNTWYIVETECDGNEPLTNKVKRLIFSDKEAV